jgi:hypothetical protein
MMMVEGPQQKVHYLLRCYESREAPDDALRNFTCFLRFDATCPSLHLRSCQNNSVIRNEWHYFRKSIKFLFSSNSAVTADALLRGIEHHYSSTIPKLRSTESSITQCFAHESTTCTQ